MNERPAPQSGDRLAKVIARAGYASRRDAEGLIADGRVAVNGKIVRTPAFNVTEKDKVEIDGRPMSARQGTRLWLYHKPAGLVVTEKDPEGRPTIFEALEERGLPRVLTVGRLDINTEGLLLLTNDGGLKRVLELPSTGWLRRYRVRAFGSVSQEQLDALKDGIEIEGVRYGPIEATLEREQGSNVWLLFGLREGKNREVKNVLGALGLAVNRLIRVSYGPFQLGDLAEGAVETVRARTLREQLGQRLAREAGVDFDSELPDALPGETPRPPQRSRSEPEGFRRDRPQRDSARPSRGGGAPQRGSRFGDFEDRVPKRRVHFDSTEGRDSELFTPKASAPGRGDRDGDSRPPRRDRPAAGAGRSSESKSFRPRRDDAQSTDRPRRPYTSREEGSGGGFAERPKRAYKPRGGAGGSSFADRPKRPFKPREEGSAGSFAERPKRAYKPRDEGAAAGFGDRPKRPYKPRSEGGSAASFADRPKRTYKPRDESGGGTVADRPKRAYKPRQEAGASGAAADRPKRSYKPRTEGTGRSGAGTGATRSFGKDGAARPARTGFGPRKDGASAPRGDRPGRSSGPRPSGGGASRPSGPRKGPRPPRKPEA